MQHRLRLSVAVLAGLAATVGGTPAAVAQTTPIITSAPPPPGLVGSGYLHQFKSSQSPAPEFVLTAGSLPPGIGLQAGGFLTGAPSGAGSFGPTTVCGVNGSGPPACQTFTIDVRKRRPAILASPSPGGAVGTDVRETASLVGGAAPTGSVTFRLFSDSACTVEVFRSTNALSLGSATSNDFTPAAPGTYRWTTSYSGDYAHEQASTPCEPSNSVAITASSPQSGLYNAIPPARILDTRSGAPVPAGGTIFQTVTGVGGVPATGVAAVVLNVTVTQPTSMSYLTVYPNGAARPLAANLTFAAGQTVPNLVVAEVGAEGKVAVFNQGGSTHVIFDVAGWFGSDGATSEGDRFSSLPPARILDTRNGNAPVAAGGTIVPTVTGVGGVPTTGVSAVVLNVTVTQPTSTSFLTVYPNGTARPLAANLNFVADQTVTNLVVAKVGSDGRVAVYNQAGSAHVVFDVVGWFGSDGSTSGGRYDALPAARILDTRDGDAPVSAGGTIVRTVTGVGGVPASGVSAVVLNVTVTQPTSMSFLTVYPSGAARPLAANLNFVTDQTVTNLVVAKVGSDGRVAVYNQGGSAHVIFDVVGWYSA